MAMIEEYNNSMIERPSSPPKIQVKRKTNYNIIISDKESDNIIKNSDTDEEIKNDLFLLDNKNINKKTIKIQDTYPVLRRGYISKTSESFIKTNKDEEGDEESEESSVNYDSNVDIKLKKLQHEYNRRSTPLYDNNKHDNITESSNSSKVLFDNITFESMKYNNKETIYYDCDKLSKMNFNDIYNVLILASYIIFVDNSKLEKNPKKSLFKINKKLNLRDSSFPGCTFFAYEAIDIIKKNIHILNNIILNSDFKNKRVYKNGDICYGINFDDGEIIKNCLYKKMEIIDMIIFIPIEKYNIKQTEYKIRGFCQIVEELGAKSINIIFKKNNMVEVKKSLDLKTDIEMLAGNLGMSSNISSTNDENYNYTLTYPSNNTITLNENTIRNKIKKKKFIVSESVYNSNLELQYLIHSRCRHLITKYSTVFTFDNNNIIDYHIFTKLKSHGIDIGIDYKQYSMNKNYMSILTNVLFSTIDDNINIINGSNVSLDSIGFNFLIESLKNTTDFEKNGIYKIMVFINTYIYKVMKHSNPEHYKNISSVTRKIKRLLTISEYAELLCNYFSKSSQWIHFTNFIDLLSNKTQSYDKLGYMIIVYNTMPLEEKKDIMLRFIQQKCIEKKIEDKFWQMIQPYNIKLKYELKNKLLYEYDFIRYYNWYNMNMMIRCIEMYTINFNSMNECEHLNALIQNMNVGYKYWEFYTNIMPFIIRHAHTLHYKNKEEIYLATIFEQSINIESFIIAKINNMTDLTQYIEKKLIRIKKPYEWVTTMTYPITVETLYDIINAPDFIENYDYINKKIHFMLGNKSIERIKEWIEIDSITIDMMYCIINKIISYNEKINLSNIPSNYIGFDIIHNNFKNGIKRLEFNKIVLPFISNHFSYNNNHIFKIIEMQLTIEKYNKYCNSYYDMLYYIKDIIKYNSDEVNALDDYIVV